jgi:hypothetical protein
VTAGSGSRNERAGTRCHDRTEDSTWQNPFTAWLAAIDHATPDATPQLLKRLLSDIAAVHAPGENTNTYDVVYPPLTDTVWPVTQPASVDASQTTAGATSAGAPTRPMG